jgi:hypothetical protein
MARVKVTTVNIKAKLQLWAQAAVNAPVLSDELIFIGDEIDAKEWQNQAWQLASMVIKFQEDATTGYGKITFVEKL